MSGVTVVIVAGHSVMRSDLTAPKTAPTTSRGCVPAGEASSRPPPGSLGWQVAGGVQPTATGLGLDLEQPAELARTALRPGPPTRPPPNTPIRRLAERSCLVPQGSTQP